VYLLLAPVSSGFTCLLIVARTPPRLVFAIARKCLETVAPTTEQRLPREISPSQAVGIQAKVSDNFSFPYSTTPASATSLPALRLQRETAYTSMPAHHLSCAHPRKKDLPCGVSSWCVARCDSCGAAMTQMLADSDFTVLHAMITEEYASRVGQASQPRVAHTISGLPRVFFSLNAASSHKWFTCLLTVRRTRPELVFVIPRKCLEAVTPTTDRPTTTEGNISEPGRRHPSFSVVRLCASTSARNCSPRCTRAPVLIRAYTQEGAAVSRFELIPGPL
ncbi:hypothetical protein V5799_031076, partial [Amblyomma americanum]